MFDTIGIKRKSTHITIHRALFTVECTHTLYSVHCTLYSIYNIHYITHTTYTMKNVNNDQL